MNLNQVLASLPLPKPPRFREEGAVGEDIRNRVRIFGQQQGAEPEELKFRSQPIDLTQPDRLLKFNTSFVEYQAAVTVRSNIIRSLKDMLLQIARNF